jgi:hypothetical protein
MCCLRTTTSSLLLLLSLLPQLLHLTLPTQQSVLPALQQLP